ncbi:hypothetical protein ACFFJY_02180 [Fictibacillus aquaticus]|nr:hypothetical protein [Fictibacillus aquaticus]
MKHHSVLLKKLVLAVAVFIVSASILLLIPDHSFHLLQAFSMGGVIYSVLLILLTVAVTFLMNKDEEKYDKAVKWLDNF